MGSGTGYILFGELARFGLLATGWHSHPLFYSIAELFSIIISACVFLLMWNSRKYIRNNCLILIGASCLFVTVIDVVHVLSWNSPATFGTVAHGLSSELWRLSRLVQAISFIIAPLMLGRRLNIRLIVAGYSLLAALALAATFAGLAPEVWKGALDAGGWGRFWIFGDLATGILYLVAAGMMRARRQHFHPNVAGYLFAAMVTFAFSEWTLILWPAIGLPLDFAGHAMQVAAFYMIYKAIVETGIAKPFHLMFLDLQKHQTMLHESLDESRRQKAQTEALLQGAHHILRQLRFSDAAAEIFSICRRVTGASSGRFVIHHHGENEVFQLGNGGAAADPVCRKHIERLVAVVRGSDRTVYRNDVADGERPAESPHHGRHCDNILLTPLFDAETFYGMLMLADKPGGFDENDVYLASAFGELVSIAMSNSRARDEMKDSEKKFRALVAHVPGAVYRSGFGETRAMEFISHVIEEISGYPADEFTDGRVRSYVSIIHPADVEMVQKCLRDSVAARGPYDIEYRIVNASGETRWVRDMGTCTHGESGTTPILDGTIFDVTSRRLADEQLQESRRILEMKVAQRTAELVTANRALESQMAERKKLEKRILRTTELEQQRIGQELHDGLGQELAGLAFMVGALARRLAGAGPQENSTMNEILELVHKAINEVRGVSKGLYPVEVRSGGLPLALRELAGNTRKLFGVVCSVSVDEGLEVRDPSVAAHIYRIAQEAVTNAIKHGKARNISIVLKMAPEHATLNVANDGRDFPADAASTGMGLQTMRHRAEVIGGTLEVASADSGGTVVRCSFPNDSETSDVRAKP